MNLFEPAADKNFCSKCERKFAGEKENLVEGINPFVKEGYNVTMRVHPFFGKMAFAEWAVPGYKHLDHHLKQFECEKFIFSSFSFYSCMQCL